MLLLKTASFGKLPADKQEKILQTAIIEFAEHGFEGANINIIAKKAGISVGSMYKYFKNKHDLYMMTVSISVDKLTTALNEIISQKMDFLSTVEKIIRAIQFHSRENVYLTKLYNRMTTENNGEFVRTIVEQIEGVTAHLYAAFIEEAQKNEAARKNINPKYFAFFLDNLFILLQFSYTCDYYKERLKMFVGDEVFADDELLVEQLMKFVKGALYLQD
ncbi:MAG TPA: TetR/AcrR family transcriptional regulator [Firmicutes bacterium]|uniref:TetR/AcrR family transcriptional regulator n=1 Tax=Capillibacterium thermochitinicola TaxID=2699427 RepID=A0A8J6I197_9FIRM|nr:TetR/AcrR family transcriptional regulator [Capillibacterium thermochitinicola]MBA2133900.1 TetR/AcrR family transcriptional regulator [Capillibacterium thermochitinicola]HHW13198.1 TetR/AcrR family transcriptional regulator [Bacillota bacterium]